MSRDALSMQYVPQARSASMSNLCLAPQLLPVCCICGFVRDETESRPQHGRWVTPRTYHKMHGKHPSEFALTHTYCPTCVIKIRKTVPQHLREIGAST